MAKPSKNPPLPAELAQLVAEEGAAKLLQVPRSDGSHPAFACPGLTSLDGTALMLGLDREDTDLGRGLVRGIWFDQPLTLWLCPSAPALRATLRVHRCHIVGPQFSAMLERARREDPCGDLVCAWELLVEDCSWSTLQPPAPNPLPSVTPNLQMLHFDNPRLH